MSTYKSILAAYVRSIGQADSAYLGEASRFTPSQKEQLANQLRRQYANNQILIWAAAMLWVILFAIGAYFALHYRDNLTALSLALGGNVMVLSGVVLSLRRLWLESSVVGALLAILPGLTPAEAAKVITTFYFNAIAAKQQPPPSVKARPAQ
jgi:hypothetical protein